VPENTKEEVIEINKTGQTAHRQTHKKRPSKDTRFQTTKRPKRTQDAGTATGPKSEKGGKRTRYLGRKKLGRLVRWAREGDRLNGGKSKTLKGGKRTNLIDIISGERGGQQGRAGSDKSKQKRRGGGKMLETKKGNNGGAKKKTAGERLGFSHGGF